VATIIYREHVWLIDWLIGWLIHSFIHSYIEWLCEFHAARLMSLGWACQHNVAAGSN
jgi:hypothetical protein